MCEEGGDVESYEVFADFVQDVRTLRITNIPPGRILQPRECSLLGQSATDYRTVNSSESAKKLYHDGHCIRWSSPGASV
jgi:hypothetical protein